MKLYSTRNFKNKKGLVPDIIFALVILTIIAIVGMIGYQLLHEMTVQIEDMANETSSAGITNRTVDVMVQSRTRFSFVDSMFMFLIVGLSIALVISAIYIRQHPAIFMIFLVVMGIMIFVNAVMSNVFAEIEGDTNLAEAADKFTVMPAIMTYFPVFMFVLAIIMGIIFYARGKGDEYG